MILNDNPSAAEVAADAAQDAALAANAADDASVAELTAHAALTSHLTADERAGVDAAFGGALTAANPPVSKAAITRRVVATNYVNSVSAIAENVYTEKGAPIPFDGSLLDTARYDYYILVTMQRNANNARCGVRVCYVNAESNADSDRLCFWGLGTGDVPVGFRKVLPGPAYTDGTANVADDTDATFLDISGLTVGDYLTCSGPRRYTGVALGFPLNPNVNAAVLAVQYWNGAAWVAVDGLVDATVVGGATMGQSGNVTWTEPVDWVPSRETTGGTQPEHGFHVRLSVSAALDGATNLASVRLLGYDDWGAPNAGARTQCRRSGLIPSAVLAALPAAGTPYGLRTYAHADPIAGVATFSWAIEAVPK